MEVQHIYEEIQIYILERKVVVVNNAKYVYGKIFRSI